MLVLCQLNRKTDEASDKRPSLAHLRGSGAIEQQARVVLFLHRPEYDLERAQPDADDAAAWSAWQSNMSKWAGRAEMIVGKDHLGEASTAVLRFEAKRQRFLDLE